ncbi:MAG: AAA family ATPase [Candidatus Saccharimonadales bacterium]
MFAADLVLEETTRQLLEAFVANPSHGLMVSGEPGIGLYTIAREIGQSVFAKGTILYVLPEEGKEISIDQVRSLYTDTKSTHEDGLVVIIDDCDRMSVPAQNALLKLLEEPPRHTLFLLTSHTPGNVLTTIRSRLSSIEARRVTSTMSTALIARHIIDANKQIQVNFLAQGRPAEILRLASDDAQFAEQASIIRDARSFLENSMFERLMIVHQYSQRDKALQLLDALSIVTIFTQRRGEQVPARRYVSVSSAIDNLHDNAHAKLQLMKLALTL